MKKLIFTYVLTFTVFFYLEGQNYNAGTGAGTLGLDNTFVGGNAGKAVEERLFLASKIQIIIPL